MKFAILKKYFLLIIITIYSCNIVFSLQTKIGMSANLQLQMNLNSNNNLLKHKKNSSHSTKIYNNKNKKNTELNRLNSEILFNGWLKYFKYVDDETQKKPKEFFKNPMYERDSKRKHEKGEDIIPSEKHFYFILFPDSLNFYNSNNKVNYINR